jgi:hypothetical protein
MALEIDMSDFWKTHDKKRQSYLGKIPSKDFWDEAYQLFLDYATPEELETDTLKRETLYKISTALGFDS